MLKKAAKTTKLTAFQSSGGHTRKPKKQEQILLLVVGAETVSTAHHTIFRRRSGRRRQLVGHRWRGRKCATVTPTTARCKTAGWTGTKRARPAPRCNLLFPATANRAGVASTAAAVARSATAARRLGVRVGRRGEARCCGFFAWFVGDKETGRGVSVVSAAVMFAWNSLILLFWYEIGI